MGAKQTKFQKFVDKHGGASALSEKIGIPRPTITVWYLRRSVPSAKYLLQLKEFSKGELSYEDIVEGTSPEN